DAGLVVIHHATQEIDRVRADQLGTFIEVGESGAVLAAQRDDLKIEPRPDAAHSRERGDYCVALREHRVRPLDGEPRGCQLGAIGRGRGVWHDQRGAALWPPVYGGREMVTGSFVEELVE